MTTIQQLYNGWKSDFKAFIDNEKQNGFGLDENDIADWEDYRDSDEYVLEYCSDWINNTTDGYLMSDVNLDCDGIIDAIVKELGKENALELFNSCRSYDDKEEFTSIDEIKNYKKGSGKYHITWYALHEICFDQELYEVEEGMTIAESFVQAYCDAIGEYLGFFGN